MTTVTYKDVEFDGVVYIEPAPGNLHLKRSMHALKRAGYQVEVSGYGYPPIFYLDPEEGDFAKIESIIKGAIHGGVEFQPTHREGDSKNSPVSDPQPHLDPERAAWTKSGDGENTTSASDQQAADDTHQQNGASTQTDTEENSVSTSSGEPSPTIDITDRQLVEILSNPIYFDEDELRNLCRTLAIVHSFHIVYDRLGSNQIARVQALVKAVKARDLWDEFIQTVYKERPTAFADFS